MSQTLTRAPGNGLALAQALGWFSIALGAVELFRPRGITRRLGLRGHEGLVRLYGVREIGTGMGILSAQDPAPWIQGRVLGDALDIATVAAGFAGPNARKVSVTLALFSLFGVAALDKLCSRQLTRGRPD